VLEKRNPTKKTKPPVKKRTRKLAPPRGLSAADVATGTPPPEIEALIQAVRERGGGVVGAYRDPVGGHWQLVASLPMESIEPTPFQRDLSETHVKRLGDVVGRMGRFLDPIIAVRNGEGVFWTPNGNHRLAAMKTLGARSIMAVVVPELSVAYQILAMNTEKSHNLREKSLEVMRMARSLVDLDPRPEKEYALEFEEPDYLTLGLAYEKRGRLSGGGYHPILRRVEDFLEEPLPEALQVRGLRAQKVIELDDKVTEAVSALKDRGFTSPYLKTFVIARINPLRLLRGASMDFDEALDAMSRSAEKFDPGKIKITDLASVAPGPSEE